MLHSHENRPIPVHIVSKRLGVPSRTIRRYISIGKIRAIRVGKRAYGVWEDEIERFQREVFCGRV